MINFAKKQSEIYKIIHDINNLKIRVIIKENVPSKITDNDVFCESKLFKWQEKIYSKTERHFYQDLKTKLSENDKKQNENYEGVFFTLVNGDDFFEEGILNNSKNECALVKKMENLKLKNKNISSIDSKSYNFPEFLQNSLENPLIIENFEIFYIMVDFGILIDEVWIKREFVICKIKYDKDNQILVMNPDFTNSEPYLLKFESDKTHSYSYYIQDESYLHNPDPVSLLPGEAIYQKVLKYRQINRKKRIFQEFQMPSLQKMRVYIFLEILQANFFEYDDIYVEYMIDLPSEKWSGDLKYLNGQTQTARSYFRGGSCFFGAPFEIELDYNLNELQEINISDAPVIFFEIVSKDSYWNRFRTEGLAYFVLPIFQPDVHNFTLKCVRVKGHSPVSELRRFFIGDYRSFENVEWINKPKNHEDAILNKFGSYTINTGEIQVRLNILNQSPLFLNESEHFDPQYFLLEKLRCSSLIKSVEEVVRGFKRAKTKMIEARNKV